MIFGNPEYFALSWDMVSDWDTQQPRFYEGLMLFYINGMVLPNRRIASADIWFNLHELKDVIANHKKQKVNLKFSNNPMTAYKELYRYTFQEESDDDTWEYRADCQAIYDKGISIFLKKNGTRERIYAGQGERFLISVDVQEGYFENTIKLAREKFFNNYPIALKKN